MSDRYKRLSLVSFRFSSFLKIINVRISNRIYAVRTPHVVIILYQVFPGFSNGHFINFSSVIDTLDPEFG